MGVAVSVFYGVVVYLVFLPTFLYTILFVGNVEVPKSIDTGPTTPLGEALILDILLLALFAVQHSVMARRSFKRWWTRIVPPAVERSTFVLAATLALALLLWQWRPIPGPIIWNVESAAGAQLLEALFWIGWGVVFLSTFLIDHFQLFGVRQVFARLGGGEISEPEFRTPLLYRYVRHPLYFGFLLGFWATPVMTAGHLLFSVTTTGYILIGIWFEERDLVARFGERYRRYRKEVSMLVPLPRRKSAASASEPGAPNEHA